MPLPPPTDCPVCRGPLVLMSRAITQVRHGYVRRKVSIPRTYYGCLGCKITVRVCGMHPDLKRKRP
jgi:hypothetical protein